MLKKFLRHSPSSPKPEMMKFIRRLRGKTAAQLIKMHRRQSEEFHIGQKQKARKIKGILSGLLPDPSPILKFFAARLNAIENEMLSRGMLLHAGEDR